LNVEDNRMEGAAPYAVLSYGFWRRAFGGDHGMIGTEIHLNGSIHRCGGRQRGLYGHGIGCLSGYFCSDHDDPAGKPRYLAQVEFSTHVVAGTHGSTPIWRKHAASHG